MKKKVLNFLKQKYFYLGLGVVFLIIAGIFILNIQKNGLATIIIQRSDFINQVSVSGKVETSAEADLGFSTSGRIGKIFVKNNQSVKAGQTLAQLEIGDLLAELKIKEINSQQEDTEVESAYRKLLTEGLELVASSDNYIVEAPEVSGIYDGAEGTYKIRIIKEEVTDTDLILITLNLERTERKINDEGSTPLGTRGLYISFLDDPDSYEDTTWYLDIPNKASSSYLANYNAYNEAKAEFENKKIRTEENDGVSSVAQAAIDKIRAEIRKSTIYAPFNGIITNIEKEVGETVATNEAVVTVMSADIFQIESYVPEVNIALIKLSDEAEVTLDAYGENVLFKARVISIDPAETIKDGISTYKIKLQFQEEDIRIKSGMTANVSILIFNKANTIVVPGGVVFEQDGKKFVQVKSRDGISDREVRLGDISSLGQVEIVAGLEAGEEVVLNPSD